MDSNVVSEDFLQRLAIPATKLRPVNFAKVGSAKKGAAVEVLGKVPKLLHLQKKEIHSPKPLQFYTVEEIMVQLNSQVVT